MMCGIAGLLDVSGRRAGTLGQIAGSMAGTLRHRGPDAHDVWADERAGIALGHERLAIVDLTAEGAQPMTSADGRFVITYNGEVYNHPELRDRLRRLGHGFRGRSDTEVLLAAITEWGVPGAIDHLNGMFAFAVWDRRERLLHLVRDRLGEKPLYYGNAGHAFVFASELKALRAHPDLEPEVDRTSLAAFFRYKYVPAPRSIYRGISKLPPGMILTLDAERATTPPDPRPYWTAADVIRAGLEDPFRGTPDEAADALDALLRDAVAHRMQADVPVGAFLSGGIDSSTVVSIMQAVGSSPARTFTIGAERAHDDESAHAREVALHLGTDHTDLVVTPDDAMDVIPRLPHVYDEPFADSSQIPTVLVSELTRRDVTVALSGDGGDELFAGYERYRWLGPLWGRAGRAPVGLRRAASRAIEAVPAGAWDTLASTARRMRPSTTPPMLGDKILKVGRVLAASDVDDAYLQLVSHWDPGSLVLGASEPDALWMARAQGWQPEDSTDRMMSTDLVTYLPDDILAKVDRATMSVSLESRIPLLDHRIAAFAWQLPRTFKVRDGTTKWLLRRVLSRYVPDHLVNRPKAGFGVPIAGWLRGPLKDWASSLLDERRLRDEGFLDPGRVAGVWRSHRSGRRDQQYLLWDVLMFEAWLDEVAATPRPVRV